METELIQEISDIFSRITDIRDQVRALGSKYKQVAYDELIDISTKINELIPFRPIIVRETTLAGDTETESNGTPGYYLYTLEDSTRHTETAVIYNQIDIYLIESPRQLSAYYTEGRVDAESGGQIRRHEMMPVSMVSDFFDPETALTGLIKLFNEMLDRETTDLYEVRQLKEKLDAFQLA